jgi:hypothetical protein
MSKDKYGVVVEQPDKTKTAGAGKICPKCGGPLTNPTHCPVDGTEPFEKRPTEPQK